MNLSFLFLNFIAGTIIYESETFDILMMDSYLISVKYSDVIENHNQSGQKLDQIISILIDLEYQLKYDSAIVLLFK